MQKWVLASNNQGKLAEFQALFDDADLGVHIITQGSLGLAMSAKMGRVLLKMPSSKHAMPPKSVGCLRWQMIQGYVSPFLATPWDFSARYAGRHGDDAANNAKLLEQLKPYRSRAPIDAFLSVYWRMCVMATIRCHLSQLANGMARYLMNLWASMDLATIRCFISPSLKIIRPAGSVPPKCHQPPSVCTARFASPIKRNLAGVILVFAWAKSCIFHND